MNKHAFIFDLDNTLVDRRKNLISFTGKLKEKYLIIDDSNRDNITEQIIKADKDGYRSKAEIYNDLIGTLPWRITPSIDEFVQYWDEQFPDCTELMESALEILEMLKKHKIKLGMITNGKSMVGFTC